MLFDDDTRYRAVSSKDARFDGMFVTGVTSTGIYCRPSCPAITPKRANVRFYPTAAAAQMAGFRACKRCRPDASPGSPEWNVRADIVARAMRLIQDGLVDREGVAGLARRLAFSERHLHRLLVAEVGAGPQSLARAYRSQTARTLIETTPLPFSEIAFAAGFASIRQFNDTIRAVFASTPSELRKRRHPNTGPTPGSIELRLPRRAPFAGDAVLAFLGHRAVTGIESWDGETYRRSLSLPHSTAIVALRDAGDYVACTLALGDVRDLTAAVQRCRRLLDLDADPLTVDNALMRDRRLRPLIKRRPGRRIPGNVDGFEMAVRAVIGQQVSVAAASTLVGRVVALAGKPLTAPDDAITHAFPSADVLAEADLRALGVPASRRTTLLELARRVADGDIDLNPGADRVAAQDALVRVPGIGPWTASYVAMRALGDPDAFLPTDLGVKKVAAQLGISDVEGAAEKWRPWRSYAVQYLWSAYE